MILRGRAEEALAPDRDARVHGVRNEVAHRNVVLVPTGVVHAIEPCLVALFLGLLTRPVADVVIVAALQEVVDVDLGVDGLGTAAVPLWLNAVRHGVVFR